MSDRTFAGIAVAALVVSAWLGLPVGLTLFPAALDGVLRGSGDALAFCSGVLTDVHPELPPFGAIALGLAAAALGPVVLQALRFSARPRYPTSCGRVQTPLRLRRPADRIGILDRVVCVDDPRRFAFCAGLAHPNIYLSIGAVRALRASELEAVLLHEAHHLHRLDPLRACIARGLGSLLSATPIMRELVERFEVAKELEADRVALAAQGSPRGLAGAMLALGRPPARVGWAPTSAWSPSSARIDQLAGARHDRLLPGLSRQGLALTAMVLLLALGLALGQAARAHLLEVSFLPEDANGAAHICPLPARGPLL